MRINVISLDRTPERYVCFLEHNIGVAGISVERFSAVDGSRLDRGQCVRDGLITADNVYIAGALGIASSHVALWRRCAAGSEPMHVAEDDVVLRPDCAAVIRAALETVPNWDFVLWGHNFDWPVKIRPPGSASAVLQYDPENAGGDLGAFRAGVASPALMPLISVAGICLYSVTPRGASRMLAGCLPLTREPAAYAVRSDISWGNIGIDVEMARHYTEWQSFISVPPVAVPINNQTASTIRGHLAST